MRSVCFNSRTPGGVRLRRRLSELSNLISFNSRTPGGVRRSVVSSAMERWRFQFTHPGRGATILVRPCVVTSRVSIHAPREGCDRHPPVGVPQRRLVSIHAPREGCDNQGFNPLQEISRFNSRTPGGVRLRRRSLADLCYPFQFTHPGRGATSPVAQTRPRRHSFNSRTPGGVRPSAKVFS